METSNPLEMRQNAEHFRSVGEKLVALAETMEKAAELIDDLGGPTSPAVIAVLSGEISHVGNGIEEKSRSKKRTEGGRLAEIRELLRQKGPLARKEVAKLSGLPKGTIAAYLTKKNFRQDDEKRWYDPSANGKA